MNKYILTRYGASAWYSLQMAKNLYIESITGIRTKNNVLQEGSVVELTPEDAALFEKVYCLQPVFKTN